MHPTDMCFQRSTFSRPPSVPPYQLLFLLWLLPLGAKECGNGPCTNRLPFKICVVQLDCPTPFIDPTPALPTNPLTSAAHWEFCLQSLQHASLPLSPGTQGWVGGGPHLSPHEGHQPKGRFLVSTNQHVLLWVPGS